MNTSYHVSFSLRLRSVAHCALLHAALAAGAWAAMAPSQLLDRLHAKWSGARDFYARYQQRLWDQAAEEEAVYQGEIRSLRPSTLRIDFARMAELASPPADATTGELPHMVFDPASHEWVPANERGEPIVDATQVIIFNGEDWRHYDPATRTVTIGDEPANAILMPLLVLAGAVDLDRKEFDRRYVIKPIESETYRGVRCYRVEIWERGQERVSRVTSTVWIDERALVPVGMVMDVPGIQHVEIDVLEARFDVGLLPAEMTLRVPPGTRAVAR